MWFFYIKNSNGDTKWFRLGKWFNLQLWKPACNRLLSGKSYNSPYKIQQTNTSTTESVSIQYNFTCPFWSSCEKGALVCRIQWETQFSFVIYSRTFCLIYVPPYCFTAVAHVCCTLGTNRTHSLLTCKQMKQSKGTGKPLLSYWSTDNNPEEAWNRRRTTSTAKPF